MLSTPGAGAAEWVERHFDPPAGSRWIIQTEETTQDNSDGHVRSSVLTTTSELTIEQKTADGFRITYVVRKAAYEGDARSTALIGPATKALENLVVRATTAANGMPVRIENLEEVHAGGRAAIDKLAASLASKPEEAAILRRIATRILLADEKDAPAVYLASIAALAIGQNTGLRPGETRHDDAVVANPFSGAPIKSNTSLRIDNADAATGAVRYIRTRTFDPDAIKEFLSKLAQQIGGADDKRSQPIDNMMKKFTMTLDSRTEIEVEEGMTRTVRQEDAAAGGTPGHNIIKHGHKLIMVTRAP